MTGLVGLVRACEQFFRWVWTQFRENCSASARMDGVHPASERSGRSGVTFLNVFPVSCCIVQLEKSLEAKPVRASTVTGGDGGTGVQPYGAQFPLQ